MSTRIVHSSCIRLGQPASRCQHISSRQLLRSSSSSAPKQQLKPAAYQQKPRPPVKAPPRPLPTFSASNDTSSSPAPKTLAEQFSATRTSLPPIPQPAVAPDLIDLLNPPLSTYPPPLNLPEPDASLPKWKTYYKLGRAYLRFYKTGFKQIRSNWKAAKQYRVSRWSSQRTIADAVKRSDLTRAEYQLLLRLKADITRLPLFALVFACFGEFTPLVVPFLTAVVPPTVRLPQQVQKRRKKQLARIPDERREEGLEPSELVGDKVAYVSQNDRASAGRMVVFDAGARLGAWSRLWDPLARSILPMAWMRARVKAKADTLVLDDYAIERDGGVYALNEIELVPAVNARGLDSEYRPSSDLRIMLDNCVKENKRSWSEEMRSWLRLETVGRQLGSQLK